MKGRHVLTLSTALAAAACMGHGPANGQLVNQLGSPLTCDPRAYGAKGDGHTNDGPAIQAAIQACAGAGGVVSLAGGTFMSGMLTLASGMTFRVQSGAVLLGSQNPSDYPDTNPPTNNSQLSNCKKALLYAEGVQNLVMDGGGVIDGNGGLPAWANSKEATRPMAVFIVQGNGVTIQDLTIQNSAMWTLVNMETDNLTISGVTVHSTQGSTRDGIDIVDCHHVNVSNVSVTSEDDSICLKSGLARGVDDVTVQNSHVLSSGVANGLKLGTASYGPFTNITFDTIDVHHADKSAMAVESVDGAQIQNVAFRNISYDDVGTPFFLLVGDRGDRPAGAPRLVGSIQGVQFQNIMGGSVRHNWGSIASGLEEQGNVYAISDVSFQNVNVTMAGGVSSVPQVPAEYAGQYPDPNLWGNVPAWGLFLRHVRGLTFSNSTVELASTDVRPEFYSIDVDGFTPPGSEAGAADAEAGSDAAGDEGSTEDASDGRATEDAGDGGSTEDAGDGGDWGSTEDAGDGG
jgi:hypothetical protein